MLGGGRWFGHDERQKPQAQLEARVRGLYFTQTLDDKARHCPEASTRMTETGDVIFPCGLQVAVLAFVPRALRRAGRGHKPFQRYLRAWDINGNYQYGPAGGHTQFICQHTCEVAAKRSCLRHSCRGSHAGFHFRFVQVLHISKDGVGNPEDRSRWAADCSASVCTVLPNWPRMANPPDYPDRSKVVRNLGRSWPP